MGQAQVKLEVIVEVGVKVRVGVEDEIGVQLLFQVGGTRVLQFFFISCQFLFEIQHFLSERSIHG